MSSTASMANSIFFDSRSIAPSDPGRTVATGAAAALRQTRRLLPGDARHRRDDELGDALAARDRHRGAAEIGEDDLDLAAVIGIDRAGAVEHRDAMMEGEARTRPDLRFVALRQGDGDPRWDRGPRARRQRHV